MKVTPVSGDLLVKLVLVAGGIGLAVWAVRRVQGAAGDVAATAWNGVTSAANAINPLNSENVFYTGVNDVLFPSGDNTLGGWFYDLLHPAVKPVETEIMGPPNIYEFMGPPLIGGSASVTPEYTGSGGAAFGMYPRSK